MDQRGPESIGEHLYTDPHVRGTRTYTLNIFFKKWVSSKRSLNIRAYTHTLSLEVKKV